MIGSFSVLVVSIVRWRRLNEQVSQVLCVCVCGWLCVFLCVSAFGGVPVCVTVCCGYLMDFVYFTGNACTSKNSLYSTCIHLQVHLLVQLALADLLAALILMYTSAINKVSTDDRVTICQYILPLSMVRNGSVMPFGSTNEKLCLLPASWWTKGSNMKFNLLTPDRKVEGGAEEEESFG